jgi:hypothetical protein
MMMLGVAGYTFTGTVQNKRAPSWYPHNLISFTVDPSGIVGQTFSVDLNIVDAENISAWQIEVVYDPYSLVVLNVTSGDFLSSRNWVVDACQWVQPNLPEEVLIREYAILIYANDVEPGEILLGAMRFDLKGVSGSGKIATITFGVWSQESGDFNIGLKEPLLLDTNGTETTRGSITINS